MQNMKSLRHRIKTMNLSGIRSHYEKWFCVANSNGTFSLEKIVEFLRDLEKTGTNAKIGARKETRD